MSSGFLLRKIKRFFKANKAGHTGTLDSLATGMLPICFGKATKLAKYLLNSDKSYQVVARLGVSTNTFDANGRVVHNSFVRCSLSEIEKCLENFRGMSYQIPPMFSSVKYNGLPLYKYARRGVDVPRASRIIYIYKLHLINFKKDLIELFIHCSKGTYVRSMINDLGNCLECGAYIIELRRLRIGNYTSKSMISFAQIESIIKNSASNSLELLNNLDKLLIPVDLNLCLF